MQERDPDALVFKRIQWKTGSPSNLASQELRTATFIGMGLNIGAHGERVRLLILALHQINRLPTTSVLAVSSLYETPPWGITGQAAFYNAVVAIRTGLSPSALLHALKQTEVQLGRKTRKRWGPREIDLDILLHRSRRIHVKGLQIPHKHLAERQFVLVPLLELTNSAALPSGQLLNAL